MSIIHFGVYNKTILPVEAVELAVELTKAVELVVELAVRVELLPVVEFAGAELSVADPLLGACVEVVASKIKNISKVIKTIFL